MKTKLTTTFLLLFLPFSLLADTLVITKSGYYLLTQDVAGVPSLTKFNQVIDLTSTSPVPPPADKIVTLKKTVTTLTTAVNQAEPTKENTKKALSQLYRTVAGLPVQNKDQLIQATDLLFNSLGLPATWIEWKKEVDKNLAGFSALEDAKLAWTGIADSLEGK